MTEQLPSGLMQAIAPIARRRPVHIIVSGASDEALRVVIQPVRTDDKEDPEVANGFFVEAPPAELDTDLPRHVAEQWVPARLGLQSVLDQVKGAAERTRQTTVTKAKEAKGKKTGGAGDSGAQTAILTAGAAEPLALPSSTGTAAQPASSAAAPADDAEASAEAAAAVTSDSPPAPASETEPTVESTVVEPHTPGMAPDPALAQTTTVPAGTAADDVSDLFT
jgi:PRTRC genetic system protein E